MVKFGRSLKCCYSIVDCLISNIALIGWNVALVVSNHQLCSFSAVLLTWISVKTVELQDCRTATAMLLNSKSVLGSYSYSHFQHKTIMEYVFTVANVLYKYTWCNHTCLYDNTIKEGFMHLHKLLGNLCAFMAAQSFGFFFSRFLDMFLRVKCCSYIDRAEWLNEARQLSLATLLENVIGP